MATNWEQFELGMGIEGMQVCGCGWLVSMQQRLPNSSKLEFVRNLKKNYSGFFGCKTPDDSWWSKCLYWTLPG